MKRAVDFSELEEGAAEPSIERAIHGEEGWVCAVCRTFRRDLVVDEGYPVTGANVAALRDEPRERARRDRSVTESLRLRALAGSEETFLHEPATEPEELREPPSADAGFAEPSADDARLEEEILESVEHQEAGEEETTWATGPRKERSPPERIPPRDPTAPELDEDDRLAKKATARRAAKRGR
ncbi:MAG: hypothetical protein ACT4PT_01455 [Methanobacteriota archaeon]